MMKKFLLAVCLFSFTNAAFVGMCAPLTLSDADKLAIDGNKAEAYDIYTNLLFSSAEGLVRGQVLQKSLICLIDLKRLAEADALVESYWGVQTNFAARLVCADSHANLPHVGTMEKGVFVRGSSGTIDSSERDRVVELRMLIELLPAVPAQDAETQKKFWRSLASALISNKRDGRAAERLLELTDFSVLPDYGERRPIWLRLSERTTRGWAPVTDAGEPVYHALPESWAAAKTDGERWRYAIEQLPQDEARKRRASFAERQFGLGRLYQEESRDSLIAELRTLTDEETLTCLQDGIHRVKLPDDYNYLKLWRLKEDWLSVGDEYANRYQFEKAIEAYSNSKWVNRHRIEAITRPALDVDVSAHLPIAGRRITFELVHRNANRAEFSICRINNDQLLERVKRNVKDPEKHEKWMDYQWSASQFLRYEKDSFPSEFLMGTTNTWSVSLLPKPDYQDTRETVEVPFDLESGDYLLSVTAEDGKRTESILHVGGLVVVEVMPPRGVSGNVCFRVVDAQSGTPQAGVRAEWFSWWERWREETNTVFEATAVSDAEGLIAFQRDHCDTGNGFVKMTATNGFTCIVGIPSFYGLGVDGGTSGSQKVFCMTDRPVYRPGDTVHFKFWSRQSPSGFGEVIRSLLPIRVLSPDGRSTSLSEVVTHGAFGGVSGSFKIPKTATLGMYQLESDVPGGSGHFRVEEYRKPEFEVSVETPTNSPAAGEVVRVPVRATYYFGKPVQRGKATVRVFRQSLEDEWVRPLPWRWLYCKRVQRPERETIFTRTLTLDGDGVAWVTIDTAPLGRLSGTGDAEYTIEADVTDESRRMVTGSGSLTVRVQPFRVHVWTDGARYHVGDVVRGSLDLDGIERADVSRQTWRLVSLAAGTTNVIDSTFSASSAGQYSLVCEVTDRQGRTGVGSCLVTVLGVGDDGRNYRFNPLELATDKAFYAPGETATLFISTDTPDSMVFLRVRRENERIIRIRGKCASVQVPVEEGDCPEFFIEAWTVSDGRFYEESLTVKVPPVKKIGRAEVEILAGAKGVCAPGDWVEALVRTYDAEGLPCAASGVMSVYDKSLDAVSGGSNVPDIRQVFWGERPNFGSRVRLQPMSLGTIHNPERHWAGLGLWGGGYYGHWSLGYGNAELIRYDLGDGRWSTRDVWFVDYEGMSRGVVMKCSLANDGARMAKGSSGQRGPEQTVGLRRNFADTAYWNASLEDSETQGVYRVKFKLPEDLTTWNVKVWAMGAGGRGAEVATEIVTRKELMLLLQAPRFLTVGDESVLSANVHNNGTVARMVCVKLNLEGAAVSNAILPQVIRLEPGQEKRVDWRIAAKEPGELKMTMSASDLDETIGDGVVRTIPVVPHTMEKTESYSRVIETNALDVGVHEGAAGLARYRQLGFPIPAGVAEADLSAVVEVSDTLSDAIVRALPYLRNYEYECSEQTMNRFVPAVVVRETLPDCDIGFAAHDMEELISNGLDRLQRMQLSSGGWGWFSGNYESPSIHTTATVLRGLLIARQNGVSVPGQMIQRGVDWLGERMRKAVACGRTEQAPYPTAADVFAAYVLQLAESDASAYAEEIESILMAADEKRLDLPFYSQAQLGLAFDLRGELARRDRIVRNLKQFLRSDDENQTCYFNLRNGNSWWLWYGSDVEAQATALMLLVRAEPQSVITRGLARYLHNNRPNRDYWSSTRDTGLVLEALSAYCAAVERADVKAPLYISAYLTYPSAEEPMTRAGLEIRVNRTVTRAGRELVDGDEVASGDLLDVRLDIDSKNDYEYIVIEDRKGAGFEPVGTRSGYQWFRDGGYAYVEYREKHVALFLRTLSRGTKSLTYRVRAETPGRYHVLPATIRAMYAPRLKGNSDELRLRVADE